MFSNLGLLAGGKCPDGEGCERIRCFFNHGGQSRPPPRPPAGTGNLKKRPLDAVKSESPSSPNKTVKKAVDLVPPTKIVGPSPSPVKAKVRHITRDITDV